MIFLFSECDDNTIWNNFNKCGEIESVRLVRDRKTGLNRGIGYVNFATEDAVTLALELNNSKMKGREIRVTPCVDNAKKSKKGRKRSLSNSFDKPQSPKKVKGNDENAATVVSNLNQKIKFL